MLGKRNYKVYANIGLTVRSTRRLVVTLDTGSGSSFIRLRQSIQAMGKEILPLKNQPSIHNVSEKIIPMVGTIDLMVKNGDQFRAHHLHCEG